MKQERSIRNVWLLIMVVTTVCYLVLVNISRIQTSGNDDVWGSSMDWVLELMFIVPIYLAEIDLYYNAKYFCVKTAKRSVFNTIMNGVASILSVLIIAISILILLMELRGIEFVLSSWQLINILLISLGSYLVLRASHLLLGPFVYRKA